MAWVKNRDRLHEAALSSIKSIAKKKTFHQKMVSPKDHHH